MKTLHDILRLMNKTADVILICACAFAVYVLLGR